MDMMWIGTAAATGLTGALVGGAGAWRAASRKASVRYSRMLHATREQFSANSQAVRASNARLQAELEKERTQAQQRIAVGIAQQRASVSRLEGQLRFAYAEIDRLNAAADVRHVHESMDMSSNASGFALTRPCDP